MLIQLTNNASKPKPKKVFYSYSHKDEEYKDMLDEHLTLLKRDGFIDTWHDRKIRPGEEWDGVINEHLRDAEIILLLVSPSFMASKYCQDTEVRIAIKQQEEGKSKVIPILLKPIIWSDSPFSNLQAIPSKGRPISSWKEVDEAFKDVVEQIRITIIEIEFPRSLSGSIEGLTGQWLLKLENITPGQNGFDPEMIVSKLKEITNDYSIRLLGTAEEQISDGEKVHIGHVLILTGNPESHQIINNLYTENTLSAILGFIVKGFHISYGSTIQTSSVLYHDTDEPSTDEKGELIFESDKYQPVSALGLKVSQSNPGKFEVIIQFGDEKPGTDFFSAEYHKILDYFTTSIVVKNDNLWVNLSAYESNRMLPKELEGTVMGRILLSQDCILKKFTASIMHPDHYLGKQYWTAVYKKATEIYGTTDIPLDTFQKVWILPEKAVVYEHYPSQERNAETDSFMEPFNVSEDDYLAIICDLGLDVKTETDLFAIKHNYNDNNDHNVKTNNDFTITLFKEIILPVIKEEINSGKNFAPIRQIYSALVLAIWFKKVFKDHEAVANIIDSDDLKNANRTISSVKRINFDLPEDGKEQDFKNYSVDTNFGIIDHIQPDDSAFEIRENREFYKQYIKLFRNGVFKCARTHLINGHKMIRLYFSGSINFRNLEGTVKIKH